MKLHLSSLFAVCLLVGVIVAGCSSSEDGPSFSDQELLNRGKAGREAATQGSKTAPTTPPAATTGQ